MRVSDYAQHYAIWSTAIHPDDSNGAPRTAAYIATMGDPIADLHEDLADQGKDKKA
jgi:spore coat protein JC